VTRARQDSSAFEPRQGGAQHLSRWLAIAAILHAGLVLIVRSNGARTRNTSVTSALGYIELSFDEPSSDGLEAELFEGRFTEAPRTHTGARIRSGPSNPSEQIALNERAALDALRLAPPAEEPNLSLQQLGLSSANPLLRSDGFRPGSTASDSERPTSTRAAEQRLEHSLHSAALERDRKLGLGRGGSIATALHSAALRIASPLDGRVEFMATISQGGVILSLEPVSVSSAHEQWSNVARHVGVARAADSRVETGPAEWPFSRLGHEPARNSPREHTERRGHDGEHSQAARVGRDG